MTAFDINVEPTRSEHARVQAYMLAMQTSTHPNTFIGDYWHATPMQENIVFGTWNLLEDAFDAIEKAGLPRHKLTTAFKKKLALAALDKARRALTK